MSSREPERKMTITINVDDKVIKAEEGITLLQVCLQNGVYIPNLCFLKEKKEPHASCRLCFVEIPGEAGPVPSCTVMVRNGMEARTDTPRVRALQKSAFRLLMSVHRVDCSHCPANRKCELQRIAKFLKVSLKPGLEKFFKEPEVIHEHPAIDYYPNRCVLCARCVRTCLTGNTRPMISFAKRGFGTIVSFFGTEANQSSCDACLACVNVCPVDALVPRKRESLF